MIAKAWQLGWLRAEATRLLADAAGFGAGPKRSGTRGWTAIATTSRRYRCT